jgi:hypothetical protein
MDQQVQRLCRFCRLATPAFAAVIGQMSLPSKGVCVTRYDQRKAVIFIVMAELCRATLCFVL